MERAVSLPEGAEFSINVTCAKRVIMRFSGMGVPTSNESWIIAAGDATIQKKARSGVGSLSPFEKLVYCVWVADYGMRNAGDLETAHDVYADFQPEATQLARDLGLHQTHRAFALPTVVLQREYFDRFEAICDEIRRFA